MRKYSDQDIIRGAKQVKSIAGLIKLFGLIPAGGNYRTFKSYLKRINPDTSHWTGQGWNSGERLKNWDDYKRTSHLKKHFLKIKDYKCENCGIEKWMESKISLELHHIDGNVTNNKIENLQLLCPNCHSITENYKGKKNKREKKEIEKVLTKKNKKKCCDCDKGISRKAIRCKSCSKKKQGTKIKWPNSNNLLKMLKKESYSSLGRKLGVSDNAIRKRLKYHKS